MTPVILPGGVGLAKPALRNARAVGRQAGSLGCSVLQAGQEKIESEEQAKGFYGDISICKP